MRGGCLWCWRSGWRSTVYACIGTRRGWWSFAVRRSRSRGGSQRERSFVMLGFTHYWGRSRKGRWVVKRKTAKDRLSRALKGIGQWCRNHRHWKLRDQQAALSRKLRGHYAYYGITGNFQAFEPIPIRSGTAVAQMARPAKLAGPHDMGPLRAPTQHLSPPRGASRAQCVPLSSETII